MEEEEEEEEAEEESGRSAQASGGCGHNQSSTTEYQGRRITRGTTSNHKYRVRSLLTSPLYSLPDGGFLDLLAGIRFTNSEILVTN